MADKELIDRVQEILAKELQKPKKLQTASYWLALEVVLECEKYFTEKVQRNLARLFIDGDFASEHHTHAIVQELD